MFERISAEIFQPLLTPISVVSYDPGQSIMLKEFLNSWLTAKTQDKLQLNPIFHSFKESLDALSLKISDFSLVDWTRRTSLKPASFVLVVSSGEESSIVNVVNQVRSSIKQRKLMVLFLNGEKQPPKDEERLRKILNLESRHFWSFNGDTESSLELILNIEKQLSENCSIYYRDKIRELKRKQGKFLKTDFIYVSHSEYKIGFLSELKGDIEAAIK